MHRLPHKQHQQGYLLIEAMIALMVVSLGALGLIRFNSTLLRDSGLSKVRAEALEIAQGRLDALRQTLVVGGCDPASPPTLALQTANGINAQYSSIGVVDQVTTERVDAQVCVAWNGSTTPCSAPVNSRVILKSTLSCTGVGTSGQIAGEGQGEGSILSGFLRSPTGRAVLGGEVPSGATQVGSADSFGNIVKRTTSGDLVLLSNNNTPLLTIRKLACETSAPLFSTIEGKILVQPDKRNQPIVDAFVTDNRTGLDTQQLFAFSSDASYCQADIQNLQTTKINTSDGKYYFAANYICYVGPEWWGNIGVVRTDDPTTSERVCVGNNPGPDIAGSIYSKKPQLGFNRGYRGYRNLGDNVYATIGIGETNQENPDCKVGTRKAYYNRPVHLKNHHFVLTSITGQANDASCSDSLTKLSATINTGTADNTWTPTSPGPLEALTVSSGTNPGKFFCLSDLYKGTDCAYSGTTTPILRSTIINGTIDRGLLTAQGSITGIATGGLSGACTTNNFAEANTSGANYTFRCEVNWSGWTGDVWSDSLTFTSSDTFCDPFGKSVTYLPSGTQGSSTVNLDNLDNATKSLNILNVSTAVAQIDVNFSIRKTDGDAGSQLECQ